MAVRLITNPDLKEATVKYLADNRYAISNVMLGEGGFGRVYRAVKTLNSGDKQSVAVKVLDLRRASTRTRTVDIPRELDVLKRVKHPNIIQVLDIFKADQKYFVFLELHEGGDLFDYMATKHRCDEKLARVFFKQLVSAIHHLHHYYHIAHRDLKHDNVLMDRTHTKLYVTDFGFAKEVWDTKRGRVALSGSVVGLQPFRSPQLTLSQDYDALSSDIWSLGVLLYFILKHRYVYGFDKDSNVMHKRMVDTKYIEDKISGFSTNLKDLFRKLWAKDEGKRIKAEALMIHSWLLSKD